MTKRDMKKLSDGADGGPAYPASRHERIQRAAGVGKPDFEYRLVQYWGKSIRDEFAMQAMQNFTDMFNYTAISDNKDGEEIAEHIACLSYLIADKMLEQRAKFYEQMEIEKRNQGVK